MRPISKSGPAGPVRHAGAQVNGVVTGLRDLLRTNFGVIGLMLFILHRLAG